MCLALSSGTESYARDAVAALDRNAVRREGPLVGQRTVAKFLLAVRSHSLVAVQCLMRIDEAFHVSCALFVDPGREICLCLIDFSGPCRTVIHVHGDFDIIAVLLDRRKIFDLLQAAVPGLACSHAAVDGDRAGVSNCAAAR